jgi:hypothetical protein
MHGRRGWFAMPAALSLSPGCAGPTAAPRDEGHNWHRFGRGEADPRRRAEPDSRALRREPIDYSPSELKIPFDTRAG